jgi:uncharacterized tellurite resistance protein B-like protein
VSDQPRVPFTRRRILEAMRAVLSDDHNFESGLASLRDLVERVAREDGAGALSEFTVALSRELAEALQRIAREQGLPTVDLIEVWFAD